LKAAEVRPLCVVKLWHNLSLEPCLEEKQGEGIRKYQVGCLFWLVICRPTLSLSRAKCFVSCQLLSGHYDWVSSKKSFAISCSGVRVCFSGWRQARETNCPDDTAPLDQTSYAITQNIIYTHKCDACQRDAQTELYPLCSHLDFL